jgi:hypothetical protein
MILPCKINNIPVVVEFNPGNNYNIIDMNLASLFKMKIDTSYTEPEILPFPILGMIHKQNIVLKTKDNKWKQVEVTEIYVTNEPERENVLELGSPWMSANVENYQNSTFTLFDGTDILPIYNDEFNNIEEEEENSSNEIFIGYEEIAMEIPLLFNLFYKY